MTKKDYYKILGVSKDATREEIKKAYKRLAKKYHPDVSKEADASEKFKEINEAAAVLGDDSKRQHYDQFGTTEGMGGFDFSGFDFSDFMGGSSFDFGDIFDQFLGGGIFGRGRRRRGPKRGADLRYDLEITLEEAATGTTKTILVPKLETCDKCKGKGAVNESDIKTCDECNGTGTVRQARRTPFGMFQTTTTCRKCGGQGIVIKEPCPLCDGNGRIEKNKKIEVNIPAGVDNGIKLRVQDEGEAGELGGQHGDLYVFIHVEEHKIFRREDNDIYLDCPISFKQAVLGDNIEVPTLDGKAELKIPSGTQTDTIFRMKNKGIPDLHGYGKGDQMVRVIVQIPTKLSKKQKDLIEQFDKEFKNKKGFFDKMFS